MTLSNLSYETLSTYQKRLFNQYAKAVKINTNSSESQFFDEVGYLVISNYEPIDRKKRKAFKKSDLPPIDPWVKTPDYPKCAYMPAKYKSRNPMHPETVNKNREIPECAFTVRRITK